LCGWDFLPGPSVFQAPLVPASDYSGHQRIRKIRKECIAVVMIRLARFGATKKPFYRIVVIEKDRARNGRSIEVVGTYNPRTSPAAVSLEHARIEYWVSVGAQLSDRVAKLVAKNPAPVATVAA
jgi:small subunit ribosomal protein S16